MFRNNLKTKTLIETKELAAPPILLPISAEAKKKLNNYKFEMFTSGSHCFFIKLTSAEQEQRKEELRICKEWLNRHQPICDREGNSIYLYKDNVKTDIKMEWEIQTARNGCDRLRLPVYDGGSDALSFGTEIECFDGNKEKRTEVFASINNILAESKLSTCSYFDEAGNTYFYIRNEEGLKKIIDYEKTHAETVKDYLLEKEALLPPLVDICSDYLIDQSIFVKPSSKIIEDKKDECDNRKNPKQS